MRKNKSHIDYVMNMFSNIMSRHPGLKPGLKHTPAKIIAIAHQTMDQIHGGPKFKKWNYFFKCSEDLTLEVYTNRYRRVRIYYDLDFDESIAKLFAVIFLK